MEVHTGRSLARGAGNQIGRAFEVSNSAAVDKGPVPKTITLPFQVK